MTFSALTVQADTVFIPQVPPIAGKAYIVTDYYSGRVISAQNPDQRIEPASLTKLMTEYLTFKAIKEKRLSLTQMLTMSPIGYKTEGSRMFLDPRVPASVSDLIRGMIVQSGNDACVTLAEGIAGSQEVFAQLMNSEAKRLGMTGTHFMNATGLPDPNHYTTVADLDRLATALIRDFPEFYPIDSMKEFRYNNITQPNRNLLLFRDPSVDGLKTGFTAAAGYNMVASSRRDGRRVISVVVGTASAVARANESAKLLNFALQFFDTPKVYAAKQVLTHAKVYKGESDNVNIGVQQDVYVTVPKGQGGNIKAQMSVTQPLIAPIKLGQVVGTLTLSLDGKTVLTRPLTTLSAVEEAGFFGRLIDGMKLKFR